LLFRDSLRSAVIHIIHHLESTTIILRDRLKSVIIHSIHHLESPMIILRDRLRSDLISHRLKSTMHILGNSRRSIRLKLVKKICRNFNNSKNVEIFVKKFKKSFTDSTKLRLLCNFEMSVRKVIKL